MAINLEEEAALKEIVAQAEAQGVAIRTSIYRKGPAATAIVRGAKRSRHDLVILGVSRRPGDTLFFGRVVAEVLGNAPCSVLLVSS
jgi:nucleotide-binding universal stress UspA family protein